MELQEGFETYGKFWINTQNHYNEGFLSIKDKKIELILCDTSDNPMRLDREIPFLYGWTDQGFLIFSELYSTGRYDGVSCFHGFDEYAEIMIQGRKFGACKCFFVKQKDAMRFLKKTSLESADQAILLSKDEVLKSNNLTFYIDHSDKWMSLDIAREYPVLCDENREIKHYQIDGIRNLSIELDNDVKLEIVIERLMQGKIRFKLIDNSDKPDINRLIELSEKITYFLQFSLSTKVKMYDINTSINNTDIEIYNLYIPDYVEDFEIMRILFEVDTINKLGCDIGNILNCWISKFHLFQTSLELYLKKDSGYRFFDLYRCLEKLASELAKIKSKSYDSMIKEFVVYTEDILSITKKDVQDNHEEIVKRIKEIRDCFVHGWRELDKTDPINDIDAQNEKFYNYLMEFIFKSIILNELGLSNDNVKLIMQNNYIKYQIYTIEIK